MAQHTSPESQKNSPPDSVPDTKEGVRTETQKNLNALKELLKDNKLDEVSKKLLEHILTKAENLENPGDVFTQDDVSAFISSLSDKEKGEFNAVLSGLDSKTQNQLRAQLGSLATEVGGKVPSTLLEGVNEGAKKISELITDTVGKFDFSQVEGMIKNSPLATFLPANLKEGLQGGGMLMPMLLKVAASFVEKAAVSLKGFGLDTTEVSKTAMGLKIMQLGLKGKKAEAEQLKNKYEAWIKNPQGLPPDEQSLSAETAPPPKEVAPLSEKKEEFQVVKDSVKIPISFNGKECTFTRPKDGGVELTMNDYQGIVTSIGGKKIKEINVRKATATTGALVSISVDNGEDFQFDPKVLDDVKDGKKVIPSAVSSDLRTLEINFTKQST